MEHIPKNSSNFRANNIRVVNQNFIEIVSWAEKSVRIILLILLKNVCARTYGSRSRNVRPSLRTKSWSQIYHTFRESVIQFRSLSLAIFDLPTQTWTRKSNNYVCAVSSYLGVLPTTWQSLIMREAGADIDLVEFVPRRWCRSWNYTPTRIWRIPAFRQKYAALRTLYREIDTVSLTRAIYDTCSVNIKNMEKSEPSRKVIFKKFFLNEKFITSYKMIKDSLSRVNWEFYLDRKY